MSETFKQTLYATAVVVIVLGALWIGITFAENDAVTRVVSDFGYVGLFVAGVISGFNVIVPIPLITFVPTFVASGLSFWLVISTITIGMTAGDALGFFVGHSGRKLTEPDAQESKLARWVVSFAEKYPRSPYILLFLYATFAPAPNELFVVPMAFLGYRLRYMAPIVLIGNFVFNTLVAFGVLHVATLF